jgi:hypothetical protein
METYNPKIQLIPITNEE